MEMTRRDEPAAIWLSYTYPDRYHQPSDHWIRHEDAPELQRRLAQHVGWNIPLGSRVEIRNGRELFIDGALAHQGVVRITDDVPMLTGLHSVADPRIAGFDSPTRNLAAKYERIRQTIKEHRNLIADVSSVSRATARRRSPNLTAQSPFSSLWAGVRTNPRRPPGKP